MLKNDIPGLLKLVKASDEHIKYNKVLFQIYKGRLQELVEERIKATLSPQAAHYAIARIAPINVLKRIVDKQSKIYASGVSRQVQSGNESDEKILQYFGETMQPNQVFGRWNAYFNLFKNGLAQPYLKSNGVPAMRVIPSDRFIPFSDDAVDPDNPTGYIIIMGKYHGKQKGKEYYLAINNTDFVYFTDEGENITLERDPTATHINEVNRVPFVYINRDAEDIMPTQDSDILAMTLLIPIILTDINYAHMFQSFSILYGINLTDEGMKWGPNSFWSFKSDPNKEGPASIGSITPQANIGDGLQLVANQFALWLNTKGIKPGAIGEVNGGNFVSGISKILDEMDTSEDRNEQIPYFIKGESEYWDLTLKHMLPYWQKRNGYSGIQGAFSAAAKVTTNFAEQVPLVRRGAVLDEVIKELENNLTTRTRALKRLHPHMTNKELAELEKELDKAQAEKNPKPLEVGPKEDSETEVGDVA